MWDYLQNLSFWDWLGLGTVLLILEVFGAGGYLLWVGIAAAGVGVLTFLLPMHWTIQFLLFAALSILTAVYWWRRQRSVNRPSDQPGLNMRGQELIGRTFAVTPPLSKDAARSRSGMACGSSPDLMRRLAPRCGWWRRMGRFCGWI